MNECVLYRIYALSVTPVFSFRLLSIFYAVALLATAMATFGLTGILITVAAITTWAFARVRHVGPAITAPIVAIPILFGSFYSVLVPPDANESFRRFECATNMKVIAAAVLSYYDVHKTFPPPFIADAQGKPMHSWRVSVLPYRGETDLYRQYDFNEPWNGPKNSQLSARMPAVFRCPSDGQHQPTSTNTTSYFAIVGPDTMWPESGGRKMAQIRGGTMNAPLLIEAPGFDVNWMEPRDLSEVEAIALLTTKSRSGHPYAEHGWLTTTWFDNSFRNIAMSDAHIEWRSQFEDRSIAAAFTSVRDRRKGVDYRWREYERPTVSHTHVKWGKVWSLTAFLILAFLPAYRRLKSIVSVPLEPPPGTKA